MSVFVSLLLFQEMKWKKTKMCSTYVQYPCMCMTHLYYHVFLILYFSTFIFVRTRTSLAIVCTIQHIFESIRSQNIENILSTMNNTIKRYLINVWAEIFLFYACSVITYAKKEQQKGCIDLTHSLVCSNISRPLELSKMI